MRLVAVTRVLDEEELIEPLIRHHAALVDHHIILDNGSTDRTLPILGALADEGYALTVLRNDGVMAAQTEYNTALYKLACTSFAADWVLFLDADEFIDPRGATDLRAYLAALPNDATTLGLGLWNYVAPTQDTAGAINVMQRFIRRPRQPPDIHKVFVRGGLGYGRTTIHAGNHAISLDGMPQTPLIRPEIRLAHYPNRSPYQFAAKAINGRLQVLAGGRARQAQSTHYTDAYRALHETPRAWLRHALQAAQALRDDPSLVDDPVPYRGTPLIHTSKPDPVAHAFQRLLATAERQAAALGASVDSAAPLPEAAPGRLREMQPLFGRMPDGLKIPFAAVLTDAWRSAAAADFTPLLAEGWSTPEPWGVWGEGDAHVLRLAFAAAPPRGATLEAEVSAYIPDGHDEKVIAVFAGGELLARWTFDRAHNHGGRSVTLPAAAIMRKLPQLDVTFRPSFVSSPFESETESRDMRLLGMALHRARLLYR